MKEEKKELSFEEAFDRLEEILEIMNSNKVTLDESLKLYEEADSLIVKCSSRLTNAEQKIEALMKKRDGSLSLDENQKPIKAPFLPSNEKIGNKIAHEEIF